MTGIKICISTVWATDAELLLRKFPSLWVKVALIDFNPGEVKVRAQEAVPSDTAALQLTTPSVIVTFPVGVAVAGKLAVTLTLTVSGLLR